jgi:hypothetical protein
MPTQIAKIIKSYGLWLCLLVFTLPIYAGPQAVGHISFAKGSNAAQQPGATPRILGKDTEIFQGDNIQTTDRSFVVVQFNDGTKVTVRPNSSFTIDHYDNQSANKTAQLVLHQGSVNTSTGNITKENPENFQIRTPAVTVKPKSEKADITVRICDKTCEEEEKKAAANAEKNKQIVVSRVVDIKGEVNAVNRADKDAKERPLSLGKPLYNSDTVRSKKDSYALLLFPDGEKVTLQADSEMDIKQYNYQVGGKKDRILFRLAAGGLRALTGSIGKNNPDAFALDTPVATIGIRGTGTDSSTDGKSLKHKTWKGKSFVRNRAGEVDVPEGSSSYTPGLDEMPQVFLTPPGEPQPPEPRPDTDKSDPKKVFEKKHHAHGNTHFEGGIYTKANRGSATVESNDGKHSTTIEESEDEDPNDESLYDDAAYLLEGDDFLLEDEECNCTII